MYFYKNYLGYKPITSCAYIGNRVSRMDVSNGIYDEIKIDDGLDIIKNIEKQEWVLSTSFQAKFQNNLEAGNVTNQGIPIQKILFRRRKLTDLTWENMTYLDYDKEIQNYDLEDRYIENNVDMQYSVSPVTQNIIGNGVISNIKTDFDSLFLTSKDYNMNCGYNLELSDIEYVTDYTIIKTLSNKYANLTGGGSNYRKGSVTCVSISDDTIENQNTIISSENKLNNEVEEYLNNGKLKLLRYNNITMLVKCLNVKRKRLDEGAGTGIFGMWQWSFDFVEIDKNDLETLAKNGLTYELVVD